MQPSSRSRKWHASRSLRGLCQFAFLTQNLTCCRSCLITPVSSRLTIMQEGDAAKQPEQEVAGHSENCACSWGCSVFNFHLSNRSPAALPSPPPPTHFVLCYHPAGGRCSQAA
jgi:hypothetical protein